MGQAQQTRGAVLIVEDDAELRNLTVALLKDEQLDTIECESAEAALAVMLIGGQHVALIFADIRLRGVMDGIDLAHEVRVRWHSHSICSSAAPSQSSTMHGWLSTWARWPPR